MTTIIPEELKPYIIKRVDGKSLNEYLPKRKSLKIIIKCPHCGYKRQSNTYDVLSKKSTKCNSCKIKEKWNDIEYKNNQLKTRNTKEYRENMSNSMKKSKAWKDTQCLRIEGLKEYWKKIRGGKELYEVYNEWTLYRKIVYKMTEHTYNKYKSIINPDNVKRGRNTYHLDHKFSILEGFKNNIPPYILSNYNNLEILSSKENISKDYKCSISKKMLFKGVFGTLEVKYGN